LRIQRPALVVWMNDPAIEGFRSWRAMEPSFFSAELAAEVVTSIGRLSGSHGDTVEQVENAIQSTQ